VIVVDCAAVVDALTAVNGSEDLRAALADEDLHAPTSLDFEVVSARGGLTLRNHITPARARDALSDFDALPIQRWPSGCAAALRASSLGPLQRPRRRNSRPLTDPISGPVQPSSIGRGALCAISRLTVTSASVAEQ